jgi:hypothetical protein
MTSNEAAFLQDRTERGSLSLAQTWVDQEGSAVVGPDKVPSRTGRKDSSLAVASQHPSTR